MNIKYKDLSKTEKARICSLHQDTCMAGCPLRVFFKRSAICLRDLEKVVNLDMKLDIDDKTMLVCRNVIDVKGD